MKGVWRGFGRTPSTNFLTRKFHRVFLSCQCAKKERKKTDNPREGEHCSRAEILFLAMSTPPRRRSRRLAASAAAAP